MLSTIYGINGVGKDAIARRVSELSNGDIVSLNNTRILMYLLNIVDDYVGNTPISDHQYSQLHSAPKSRIKEMEMVALLPLCSIRRNTKTENQ